MESNPFYQVKSNWSMVLEINFGELEEITSILENYTHNISSHEIYSENISVENLKEDKWEVNAYFEEEPDIEYFKKKLGKNVYLLKIEDKDWVSIVQNSLEPVVAGRFYIHNSSKSPSQELINIQIDPARAFGSGHHESTSNCLNALSLLDKKFNNILDLGTGSGILAIAAAKLWKSSIIASDIDEVSLEVVKENLILNNCQEKIEIILSDGFSNIEKQKFDLIIANILAPIIINLIDDFVRYTQKDSIIILSGILENQVEQIMESFQSHFKLVKLFNLNKWATIIMERL